MAGKDVDLPSGLHYLPTRLHDGHDHPGCSISELPQIVFVAGTQINVEAALHNNFEACKHFLDRLSIGWSTKEQEVEVLQEI